MKKQDRLSVVKAFSKQYRRARKKEKSVILTKLPTVTGYSRKHLMEILANPPKRKRIRRIRISKYVPIHKKLRQLWALTNYACGQRLVALIPIYLQALETHEGWKLKIDEKQLLLKISAATIDRLLTRERKSISLKGRSRTKPGSLLKHQIPIKTYADWDNATPGFVEIDTVHHCGDSAGGEYIHTLDVTDVATGWNECSAFMGRSYQYTIKGLDKIRRRLPFPLLGVDFDTGGEFVNYHLIRYCQKYQITYTRAREGNKHDQGYVEQQNYSVVRRFVGYARLNNDKQLEIVNRIYQHLSDYQNFFQSVMRLKEKVRDGTRLTRRYDRAKTPYQRIMERPDISPEIKVKLQLRFKTLNPKRLILEITRLGKKLSQK